MKGMRRSRPFLVKGGVPEASLKQPVGKTIVFPSPPTELMAQPDAADSVCPNLPQGLHNLGSATQHRHAVVLRMLQPFTSIHPRGCSPGVSCVLLISFSFAFSE